LQLGSLRDAESRTKTFSCQRCGSEAYFCVVEAIKERGVDHSGGELPGRKIDLRR